jgi:hypothetical protein
MSYKKTFSNMGLTKHWILTAVKRLHFKALEAESLLMATDYFYFDFKIHKIWQVWFRICNKVHIYEIVHTNISEVVEKTFISISG